MPDAYKTVSLTPLTGILDARSSVDQEPAGAFTAKNNFEISPDGKLCQAHGFVKPYTINPLYQNTSGVPCPYKNWDWHEQGVAVAGREPPTLLFASTTNDGARQLILGTKTRLMLLDETAGSWSKLNTAALGNDGSTDLTQTRFHAAELQNKVVFTNGIDNVQYYNLLSPFTFAAIPDLGTASETGGLVTKAKVVVQWQGVIFLMNTVEDGVRIASRIRWSDLNNALNWGSAYPDPGGGAPAETSISDYQDLDYGEEILNAVPLLGSLYVFTNQSIWLCSFSIDTSTETATLNCVKIYTDPRNQNKCLAYPNTLVSTGFEIYYAGRDGIYEYDPYKVEPELTEWIHRADSIIYDDTATAIDKTCCNSPISEYRPDTKEIHFSWPSPDVIQVASDNCDALQPIQGSGINRHTLVINTAFTTCDYRDYGSTALVNFKSDVGTSGSCNQAIMFLGTIGSDFCLKQFGIGYAREIYDPLTDAYSMVGYVPLLRLVFPLGNFDKDKSLKSFSIHAAPEGDFGTFFKLRIGTSYTIQNPNLDVGKCGVLWRPLSLKEIKCQMSMTPEQYAAKNVRPSMGFDWAFLYRGRYLYAEIAIVQANGTAPVTGGVSLSAFETKALLL